MNYLIESQVKLSLFWRNFFP